MRSKVLGDDKSERTFPVVFDTGDEVMEALQRFAEQHALAASRFTAIGAFRDVVLGYFDWERKDYERIAIREQVDFVALIGDPARGLSLIRSEPDAERRRRNAPPSYTSDAERSKFPHA